jgi:membrane-associated phospholipid phosphatase
VFGDTVFKILQRDASVPTAAERPAPECRPWTAGQIWAGAAVLSALAAAAVFLDLPLANYLHEHGLPAALRRPVRLAETFGWGGSVALLILTAAILDRRGWQIIPRLALGALGAGLLADGVKFLVARLRPAFADLSGSVRDTFVAGLPLLNGHTLGRPYGHALQSFPSAHAATAAGFAVGLAALYPRGRWLFVAFAVLACIQRMDARAHFASDVMAGAALGCIVGALLASARFAWLRGPERLHCL